MHIKRIILTVVTAVLAVTLVPPAAQAATPSGYSEYDKAFVRALRAYEPDFYAIRGGELVRGAKLTCKVLRNTNQSMMDLAEAAIDAGMTEEQAFALIAASVTYYCPDQAGNVV